MVKSVFDEYVSDPQNLRNYQQERAILQVTSLIEQTMKKIGVTRVELAHCLETTKSRITELLDGEGNKTIRTVADIFAVLGYEFHGHIRSIRMQHGSTAVITDPPMFWQTDPDDEWVATIDSQVVGRIAS